MTIDEEVAADLARMGAAVPPELVSTEDDGAIEVWRDNQNALRVFLATETQWRTAVGLAGIIWFGLDYNAVDVVMRRTKAPDLVFEQIQEMEAAALQVFGESVK